ncbi:polysaccharide deacetylase family protein [Bacillus benzoevorans]|uniref:Peptidoglycan/xylan/chitin deacetylase (PgdA/CDA1 family) n=1 Tax=Bacillus benzoevorans TaxID=1456 RepID=A0A7X0LX03_9BACI|nr:polysaccharide deacetylase family protein [Bacillus benzoevorans]MBB6447115.1 peptidoglycan/xylan/chitin deacetylase (PgdA/CDA1 family) [Bacillus benzoevorans]
MKKTVSFFLFLFILFLPFQVFAERRVPILVYHWIDEYTGVGPKDLYVMPKNFAEQMKYLRDQGFTLLTFERWQDIDKVNKPIFITFDDGYKDNLNVLAIFEKLQSDSFKPAGTIFVISDFIGRSNRLSRADLKKLSDSGLFSIQSHTATHPNLTKITNYSFELKESKEKIQNITGKPVIALAYPYGSYNDKVIAETKKYYSFGITTIPKLYSKQGIKDENYLIPRIYINYSTSLKEFANMVGE